MTSSNRKSISFYKGAQQRWKDGQPFSIFLSWWYDDRLLSWHLSLFALYHIFAFCIRAFFIITTNPWIVHEFCQKIIRALILSFVNLFNKECIKNYEVHLMFLMQKLPLSSYSPLSFSLSLSSLTCSITLHFPHNLLSSFYIISVFFSPLSTQSAISVSGASVEFPFFNASVEATETWEI